MSELVQRRLRCAVYTRKSTEEGLEQEFNSLDAQREAGESYILSQRHEGWTLVPTSYDDGGYTGGNTERPALKRLMQDIKDGLIDIVVVYKIDRLSRSLLDFLKLVEIFDKSNVSFVSVTQHFNTKEPMGRLFLNIMLSFAQFEREIAGERIRDKVAASKRKGMWMGGPLPLGYDVVDRKLLINDMEAEQVEWMFRRFVTLRSTTLLMHELKAANIKTKAHVTRRGVERPAKFLSKGQIYNILRNRIYLGEITHKGKIYPGLHKPLISSKLWDAVRAVMAVSPRVRGKVTVAKTPSLLKGLVQCGGSCGSVMSSVHTRKNGKLYRYYKPSKVLKSECHDCPIRAVPAGDLEDVVVNQLQEIFQSPDLVVKTWAAINRKDKAISEASVRKTLQDIKPVWHELFPVEQARIVNLLIEKIIVHAEDGVEIHLQSDKLTDLAHDFLLFKQKKVA